MRFDKIKLYFKESFNELRKINWLSKKETVDLTIEVLIFSLIFVIIYGLFDGLFIKFLFLISS